MTSGFESETTVHHGQPGLKQAKNRDDGSAAPREGLSDWMSVEGGGYTGRCCSLQRGKSENH